MFLTNSINKTPFNPTHLYEDIINFNEEYNDLKYNVMLQEHALILEGGEVGYLNEGLVEGFKKILTVLINAIKNLILRVKDILIASRNKLMAIFNKNTAKEAEINKSGISKILDNMKDTVHNCFKNKTNTGLTLSLAALGGTFAYLSTSMFRDSIKSADGYTQQMIDIAEREKSDLEKYMKMQEQGDPGGLLAKAIDEKRSRILQVGWAIASMQKSYPLLYRMFRPKKMEHIKSYDRENDPNF
jgi:hypothetical protein